MRVNADAKTNGLQEKTQVVLGREEQNPRRECGTGSPSKRGHFKARVGQDGAASHIMEGARQAFDRIICYLSNNHVQASSLYAEAPCPSEAAIIRGADTKKDVTSHLGNTL